MSFPHADIIDFHKKKIDKQETENFMKKFIKKSLAEAPLTYR